MPGNQATASFFDAEQLPAARELAPWYARHFGEGRGGVRGLAVRRWRPPTKAGHDGGPPAVTGPERPVTLGPIRGGRAAGRLRSVRLRGGTVSHC